MKNAQGSFSKATIANRPEIGETEVHISITDSDLEAMEDV
jgi:hypothetical protein